jgi:DNA-binding HxlR family transcriptional regulator
MYSERILSCYESCSLEIIRNSLKFLVGSGICHRTEDYRVVLREEYALDETKLVSLSEHID